LKQKKRGKRAPVFGIFAPLFVLLKSKILIGFDAYQKLIDSDVDIVLLATPPYFRPVHFEGAINARKQRFHGKTCSS
jgi:hypothetical protein